MEIILNYTFVHERTHVHTYTVHVPSDRLSRVPV